MGARFVERGGLWLLAQMPLMIAAITLAPWLGSLAPLPVRAIGIAMAATGIALVVWSRATLGPSFTAFPKPVDGGTQASGGPYRFVRHPIYTAVVLCLAGWALLWQSVVAGALVSVLALLLDFKARREEAWLASAYTGYAEYRRRVRKFIPFIY
jgi:protein-S-isoprenylcysteine O-methyltransferase Ste14